MITYNEFLEKCNVISEEDFNRLIFSLPQYDYSDLNSPDITDIDDVATAFIECVLNDFDWVYVDSIDANKLEFELGDIRFIEDLEEIKKLFPKWTITNYDKLKSELEKELEEEEKESDIRDKFDICMSIILKNASLEDLEKIIKDYNYD